MWVVTSGLLAVVGVGMVLVAWMAFRTADELPDRTRGSWLWAAAAVVAGGLGLWTVWAAAFILAGNV